jgi:hypothetical protein
VRGQPERPAERAVAHLAQRAPVLLLRVLVAALTVDDQAAVIDLDVDVLLDVHAR